MALFGNGVTGTATITVSAKPFGSTTSISATKTVTMTGTSVSAITLELLQKSSAASSPTASIIIDIGTTSNDTDELVARARVSDSDGNLIVPASGLVTFKITNSSGSPVALLSSAAEVNTGADAAVGTQRL